MTICAQPECDRKMVARGWCTLHYDRWRQHGDPQGGGRRKTPIGEARAWFESHVVLETDECIIWPYGKLPAGYGVLDKGYVHVMACELAHGPRPRGYEAAHGPCHNTSCMNPRHVRWATPSENHGADKRRDGTINTGERNGGAKLTEAQVGAIRAAVAGGQSQLAVSRQYGISNQHISRIVTRKKWADVP